MILYRHHCDNILFSENNFYSQINCCEKKMCLNKSSFDLLLISFVYYTYNSLKERTENSGVLLNWNYLSKHLIFLMSSVVSVIFLFAKQPHTKHWCTTYWRCTTSQQFKNSVSENVRQESWKISLMEIAVKSRFIYLFYIHFQNQEKQPKQKVLLSCLRQKFLVSFWQLLALGLGSSSFFNPLRTTQNFPLNNTTNI